MNLDSRPWAVTPIDMNAAAQALGISRRTLVDKIKDFPYFERRGVKKVFYPEHIASLRKEMHKCGSKSNGQTDGHTSTGLDPMASASDVLSKLATLAKQRKPARR